MSTVLKNNPAPARKSKRRRGPNDVSPLTQFSINSFYVFYSIVCIVPVILVFMVSISSEKSVLVHGYSFLPNKFSLEAYRFLLDDWGQIARSYGISIFVTVVGTLVSLLFMSLYAYPISRKDFPHRNFFSFFMFFTMLFNGGMIPWYLVYTQVFHLKDNLLSLILPLLVSAFFVMILRTFFMNTIPVEVLESAKIDGASEFRIFAQIVLPLSLPVLATVGLFQTLNYWNDWFNSLVFISDPHKVNLQFLMYRTMLDIQFLSSNVQAAQGINQSGGLVKVPTETVRMAMAIMGIGPIVLAYPFFQRYFVQGLTVGAVKG